MGKRDDILAATIDVVVDEGLPALSFSKIFEKAEVGAGTVYHYFSGKEALVLEVYRTVTERVDRAVLSAYDKSAPLKVRFGQLVTGIVRFALDYPRELAFVHSCSHAPSIPIELRHRVTESMEVALGLFEEGQRDGVFAPMPSMVALAVVTGAVTSLAEWVLADKLQWDDGLIGTVIDTCWKGLSRS
jgi:AcrR family transcriptional regulator